MATPQQILSAVSAASSAGKVKRQQANTQGTRGAPGRGGAAARPVPKLGGVPGGQSRSNAGGVARKAPDGINSMSDDGRFQTAIGPGQSRTFPGFKPRMPVDPAGADLMAKLGGREPGPGVEPAAPGTPSAPLWKQIQDLGGQGTGSFAGNRELLAKLQAEKGMGPTVDPAGDASVSQAAPQGPQIGGVMPPPPPGADMATAPPSGGVAGSYLGFKPRSPLGGGGMQARPMPTTVSDGVTAQTTPGQIPNETPGAAGRPGGPDVAGRFRPPRAMPTYNPLR